MKITQLYTSNREFPYVTLAVCLACILVTAISLRKPVLYNVLAWKYPLDHFWQFFSGAFLHGTNGGGASMAVSHLCANLFMFLPMAVMLEKRVGHSWFALIFLLAWLGSSLVFQLVARGMTPKGESGYGAGLSGVAYSMIAIGFCILMQLFLKDKGGFFCQPLAYVFTFGFVGELVMLTPALAGSASMMLHIGGLVIGFVLMAVFHNNIFI